MHCFAYMQHAGPAKETAGDVVPPQHLFSLGCGMEEATWEHLTNTSLSSFILSSSPTMQNHLFCIFSCEHVQSSYKRFVYMSSSRGKMNKMVTLSSIYQDSRMSQQRMSSLQSYFSTFLFFL